MRQHLMRFFSAVPRFIFRYTALIILLTGFIANMGIFYYVSSRGQAKDDLRFETTVLLIENQIKQRLNDNTAVLRTGTALFAASDEVSAQEFNIFTNEMTLNGDHPGMQGIGYAQRLGNGYPTVFWESLDNREENLIGYDIYQDPSQRDALSQARDQINISASKKINIPSSNDRVASEGFMMYSPVYQKNSQTETEVGRKQGILGYIYGTFIFNEFFDGVLSESMKRQLHVSLYDVEKKTPALFYSSTDQPNTSSTFFTPRLEHDSYIKVGGRNWILSVNTQPYFYRDSDIRFLPLLLSSVTLITAVLFLFAHWQWRSWEKTVAVTASLQKSQEELLRSEKQKDIFISIASHELKTPLTSIKAFAQLLEESLKAEKNVLHKSLAQKVTQQIDKLTELVNDLLDVSRIQNGQIVLRKENFDLRELVEKTLTELKPVTDHPVDYVESKDLLLVTADPYRVTQVITNLFTNAAKYSPQAKKIVVRTKKVGDTAVVSVRDFGIGIEKSNVTQVFHKFFRARKGKQQAGGLGLGLYISAQIIKQHEGKIWVESTKDKGSTFFFSLPLT